MTCCQTKVDVRRENEKVYKRGSLNTERLQHNENHENRDQAR